MKTLKSLAVTIGSDTSELCEVERFIDTVFSEYGLGESDYYRVILCVKEAVTNSIIHGNKSDKLKKVVIRAYRCHTYLYFSISDEGEGFDYLVERNPTDHDRIMEEGGRGLYLIKNSCDGLFFRKKGKTVEFKINLDGQY